MSRSVAFGFPPQRGACERQVTDTQSFQRNIAVEHGVAGAMDLAHASGAKLREDLIQTDAGARSDRHLQRIIGAEAG